MMFQSHTSRRNKCVLKWLRALGEAQLAGELPTSDGELLDNADRVQTKRREIKEAAYRLFRLHGNDKSTKGEC